MSVCLEAGETQRIMELNPPHIMDIISGVHHILEMYDNRVPHPIPFKIVGSSSKPLFGPAVLRALLSHAPGKSHVAMSIWNELSSCFRDLVDASGDHKKPGTIQLEFYSNNLDAMGQEMVDRLTGAINDIANNWVGVLILPSTRLLHSSSPKAEILPPSSRIW